MSNSGVAPHQCSGQYCPICYPPWGGYTYSPAMLVVGPCEGCGRNYVINSPMDRQPIPKKCRECLP